jgi:hypothetical protein
VTPHVERIDSGVVIDRHTRQANVVLSLVINGAQIALQISPEDASLVGAGLLDSAGRAKALGDVATLLPDLEPLLSSLGFTWSER